MFDISDLYLWWDNHFDQYKKDLADYVAIPSIAVKEDDGYPFGKPCYDMLLFIKSLMKEYGLDANLIENVFAQGVLRGQDNCHSVAIACHGDVVPVSGEWERCPFELFEKEGHLVGRGTTDNKGAGIAVLYSLRYLMSKGWKPNMTVKLLFGSAEEIGMPDCQIAFKNKSVADFTLVPDSGFPVAYGEKASLKYTFSLPFGNKIRAVRGGTGVGVADFAYAEILATNLEEATDISFEVLDDGWTRVEAKGKGRHSATPDGGVDAFLVLFKYISNYIEDEGVNSYISFFSDFYGTGLKINCSDSASGSLTAVVTKADNSLFTLNMRLPLKANMDEIQKKLAKILPNCKLESKSNGYCVELDYFLMNLNKIACDEYNFEKKPYVMSGGTYARVMQPSVAFGMGSPSGNVVPPFPPGQGRAHQINESVAIDRMKKGFAIYVKALLFMEKYFNGTL